MKVMSGVPLGQLPPGQDGAQQPGACLSPSPDMLPNCMVTVTLDSQQQ